MNKPKAPKDMSLAELLEEYKKERVCARCQYESYCAGKEPAIFGRGESLPNCSSGRIWMERKINEPAPNPFTPDRLAVMREYQRDGLLFSAMDYDYAIHVFSRKPYKYKVARGESRWMLDAFDASKDVALEIQYTSFLNDALEPSDDEPLCFADYAPLEGAANV